ncbi:MAG TPA: FAD-binding oxidoreductase [Candidatus Binataceae bacterium]|nr:FAD-binding oxidoreductase [Candidatus Binataceae bacterium]
MLDAFSAIAAEPGFGRRFFLLALFAMTSEATASIPGASVPARAKRAMLSGWGRYPALECDLYRPEKLSELAAIVAKDSTSVIARGAGRAYGDAAVNAGNRVIEVTRLGRMLSFDPKSAILRAEAGVTLDEIIEVFLPRGYFPPVVPGTRYVTLGGSIAADIHGKSHHRDSSLASHIVSFDLLLASGEIQRCSREDNPELFRASVGAMGLTGVILEAELRLRRVESAWLAGELIRAENLDAALEAFERTDREYANSVAWIDCASSRGALGRSILNVANFAPRDSLPPALRQQPFELAPKFRPAVPINLPGFALGPLTVRAFNGVYYAMHRASAGLRHFDYQSFFFPLDSIHDWNRIYGKRGFVQYQCVWPEAQSRAGLIEILEAISASRRGSFLTVLKKFGAQDGMLSFPMPGYTLALDFPVAGGLMEFLDRLDAMVLARGGRVYLAKDARMRPETFRAMYPNLNQWRQIKDGADPNHRFSSSLARRLGMLPA